MSKLIKVHTLIMCSLLDASYLLIMMLKIEREDLALPAAMGPGRKVQKAAVLSSKSGLDDDGLTGSLHPQSLDGLQMHLDSTCPCRARKKLPSP